MTLPEIKEAYGRQAKDASIILEMANAMERLQQQNNELREAAKAEEPQHEKGASD